MRCNCKDDQESRDLQIWFVKPKSHIDLVELQHVSAMF